MEVKRIGETMTRNLLEEVRRQKDMKGIGKRIKKELFPVLSGSVVMMEMLCTRVMAADTSSVTKPLDNLKTLVIAIIGAIGVIILANGVCPGLSATGFIHNEFSIKRNSGWSNDGRYIISSWNPWILVLNHGRKEVMIFGYI